MYAFKWKVFDCYQPYWLQLLSIFQLNLLCKFSIWYAINYRAARNLNIDSNKLLGLSICDC